MLKDYLLPGGKPCASPDCDEAAVGHCDSCGAHVCEEHLHDFTGHYLGDCQQCETCVEGARR